MGTGTDSRAPGSRLQPGDPEQDLETAVRFHQRETVDNYLGLKAIAPDLPFLPVLQGWRLTEYETCAVMYEQAGVDLAAKPVVGLGSVCRRQGTAKIGAIVTAFADRGLRLHGFGVPSPSRHLSNHLRAPGCQRCRSPSPTAATRALDWPSPIAAPRRRAASVEAGARSLAQAGPRPCHARLRLVEDRRKSVWWPIRATLGRCRIVR